MDRIVETHLPPEWTSEVGVRRATMDDVNTLVELRIAMQVELGDIAPQQEEAVSDAIRGYLRERLETEELVVLLAEAEQQTMATGWLALFQRPPSRKNLAGVEGYVFNMYTAPEWRGRGVARMILDELLSAARVAGARRVSLRASDAGRPVYEKAGFQENPRYMQIKL